MKRMIILVLALLVLAGCSVQSGPKSAGAAYRQVDMPEAMEMMETETDYIILDVRTEAEYNERHIPGAVLVPNETITDQKPEQLPDLDQLILVYCRSGNRSKQASQKLADMGYTNIVEFGGITDWPGETVQG